MHRDDTSKYLLYIEPKASEKLKSPIEDELTQLMEMALSKAISGGADYDGKEMDGSSFRSGTGWRGTHRTACGEGSSNHDYKLENGMITNSLAPFYVKWYRYSIPENDMNKLEQLKQFYNGKA